jgi:hypothetical protein
VEVDGVLPGDHLLLPGRSALALPLRHLCSSGLGSGSVVVLGSGGARGKPYPREGSLLYEQHTHRWAA